MGNELKKTEEIPSYVTAHGGEGVEKLDIQTVMPRIKLVQSMTDKAIKMEHGEGALVLMPDQLHVADAGEALIVAPLYRWVSYQKWAHLEDQDVDLPIVEESTDIGSDLAERCRNRNLRFEDYPGGRKTKKGDPMQYRYCESINYAVEIQSGECAGTVAVYSFSRSGHKYGSRLSRYIDRQGERGVDLYANRLEWKTEDETQKGTNNTYSVLNFAVPDPAYQSKKDIERLRELWTGLKEAAALRVAPE